MIVRSGRVRMQIQSVEEVEGVGLCQKDCKKGLGLGHLVLRVCLRCCAMEQLPGYQTKVLQGVLPKRPA